MAKNLELREKIVDTFDDSEDSLIYIRTHVDQVDGLLDENGIFNLGLIPSSVLETKKLAGIISEDKTLAQIFIQLEAFHDDQVSLYPGSYFMIKGEQIISSTADHVILYGDDGAGIEASSKLENGDHLFYIKYGTETSWDLIATPAWAPTAVNHDSTVWHFESIEEMNAKVPVLNKKVIIENFGLQLLTGTPTPGITITVQEDFTKSDIYNELWNSEFQGYEENIINTIIQVNNGLGPTYYQATVNSYSETGRIYYLGTSFVNKHFWGVINSSYDLATLDAQGLMSPAMVSKLAGISINANNYQHDLDGANETLVASGTEKIAGITVNLQGHVTAVSLEEIQDGTTGQKGILQLANVSTIGEWKTGQSTTKPAAPNVVKSMIDYFAGMKVYGLVSDSTVLTNANAAHAVGGIALFESPTT